MRIERAIILVADGVGCGGAPDAAEYGDAGADTLGNLSRAVGPLALPNLELLGLGHTTTIAGVGAGQTRGAYGTMTEASAGKDTITGHWEMAGLVTNQALPTFPQGFPPLILDELYAICERARAVADRHRIGRVIARPFVGTPGHFQRTYNRRDYSLVPPEPTLCDSIVAAGLPVVGVGKISDIFAGRGISTSLHSEGNVDGLRLTLEALPQLGRGLLFVNLVDFDMLYGHRNDTTGFYRGLRELDDWLPAFQGAMRAGDVAFITADHGNDPTTPGTDHTRERVPLLAFGPGVKSRPLGVRASFCDLGQTIADGLDLAPLERGESFLNQLV